MAYASEQGFKPMAVGVIDARGALKTFAAQDGTSLKRGEIALGQGQWRASRWAWARAH